MILNDAILDCDDDVEIVGEMIMLITETIMSIIVVMMLMAVG